METPIGCQFRYIKIQLDSEAKGTQTKVNFVAASQIERPDTANRKIYIFFFFFMGGPGKNQPKLNYSDYVNKNRHTLFHNCSWTGITHTADNISDPFF